MKKLIVRCAVVLAVILLAVTSSGCSLQATERATPLGQRTTLEEASDMMGVNVPAPTYLPEGYKIQEVYIKERGDNTVDRVVLLISDEEIEWHGNEYQYKIRMRTTCGFVIGLKMPWARQVKIGKIGGREVWGHLVDKEGDYNELWYQWQPDSHGWDEWFEIVISASKDILEEELIKVAESTLY